MIDALLLRRANKHPDTADPNYRPSDAIVARHFMDAGSNKLAVIFPGWHTHIFPVNILAKRLVRNGWSVIIYEYNDHILEPDDRLVKESMLFIRDKACQELEQIVRAKPFRRIHFISISVGGVPMALVCDKFKHFSGVTAVVGGDDLAVDMWHGERTQNIRKAFEKMHIGIRKLAGDWDDIGPDHHLRHFKGKPIKFIMSKNDTYVPTKYQMKLAQELAAAGANIKMKARWTGHSLTILRYCLFDNPV